MFMLLLILVCVLLRFFSELLNFILFNVELRLMNVMVDDLFVKVCGLLM